MKESNDSAACNTRRTIHLFGIDEVCLLYGANVPTLYGATWFLLLWQRVHSHHN